MIEAIIFDKDGTLLDFDAFWIPVSIHSIEYILNKIKKINVSYDELLNSIGVKNGVSDRAGILCKGTYEQIAIAFNNILKKYNCNIAIEKMISLVIEAYTQSVDFGEVKPTCENIKDVLSSLKERGKKLIVITTDNYEITDKCLKKLGIGEMFDKIYADDGINPTKPDPYSILEYSKSTGIDINNIVMVGDTMTDVKFARNAGVFCIGVEPQLENYADVVIPDISHIFEVLPEEV